MASRLAKKPDPAIKKNVLRSRAEARKANNTHASVVVTSLLGTLLAWALFTYQDIQVPEGSQAASSQEAALTITNTAQDITAINVGTTQLPFLHSITR